MADAVALKTTDFNNPKQVLALALEKTEKGSGFQKAIQRVNINGAGTVQDFLGQTDAEWVEESGLKPVKNPGVTSLEVMPKKMAKVVFASTEGVTDIPGLWDKLMEEATGSLARTFDKTLAGFITAPAAISTYKDAAAATVTSYKTFVEAIAAVNGDYPTTGIVLTTVMLDSLRAAVTINDVPALQISGDYSAGTINGIPYFIIAGTTAVGFVGPFATRAFWGVVPGSVRVEQLKVIENSDGTVRALEQRNEIGMLVEARFAHKIVTIDEFKKLTVSGS